MREIKEKKLEGMLGGMKQQKQKIINGKHQRGREEMILGDIAKREFTCFLGSGTTY